MLRALGAAILILGLTGCQNLPPPYPPPTQFVPFETFRSYRLSRIISVGEEGAADHFVSDILPSVGGWSWTNKRPTIKLLSNRVDNVHYMIDFVVADETLKTTGPVAITFFVNDHVLGSQSYDKSGAQHWEKLVPPEWLQPKAETLVAAEVDKVWMSPADGAKLGFILTKMGLQESQPQK